MKKTLLLFLLLPFLAVASHAQESRQDLSLSVTGIFRLLLVMMCNRPELTAWVAW
jgi:hypothetical protein